MIVDTHAHLYHPDTQKYPMVEDPSRPPEGTGTVEHLQQNMREAGVERAVLVQTGSAYRWDNRLLADMARVHKDWAVGVCTLDPQAQESVGTLERLAKECNVRGVRVEATRGRRPVYDQPGAARLWEAAGRLGLVVCAHLQAGFLEQLAALLGRTPDVPVVLDHAAYPKATDGADSQTVRGVVSLARFRQLHIKLTFLVTGSDETYPFADTHETTHRILDAFGPERCVWGSDFPCEHWLKKADYGQHLDLIRHELGLSPGDVSAILEETPRRLWFPGNDQGTHRG